MLLFLLNSEIISPLVDTRCCIFLPLVYLFILFFIRFTGLVNVYTCLKLLQIHCTWPNKLSFLIKIFEAFNLHVMIVNNCGCDSVGVSGDRSLQPSLFQPWHLSGSELENPSTRYSGKPTSSYGTESLSLTDRRRLIREERFVWDLICVEGRTRGTDWSRSRWATILPSVPFTLSHWSTSLSSTAPSILNSSSGGRVWRLSPKAPWLWSYWSEWLLQYSLQYLLSVILTHDDDVFHYKHLSKPNSFVEANS